MQNSFAKSCSVVSSVILRGRGQTAIASLVNSHRSLLWLVTNCLSRYSRWPEVSLWVVHIRLPRVSKLWLMVVTFASNKRRLVDEFIIDMISDSSVLLCKSSSIVLGHDLRLLVYHQRKITRCHSPRGGKHSYSLGPRASALQHRHICAPILLSQSQLHMLLLS